MKQKNWSLFCKKSIMKGAEFILPLLLSTRCIVICGDGRKNEKLIPVPSAKDSILNFLILFLTGEFLTQFPLLF